MAMGLLAAIIGAIRSGQGRDVDVSLFDVALHQLSYPATWYLNTGHRTERLPRSAHPSTVPCQVYRTADGWVMVMCMLEKFWHSFIDGLGSPAWAQKACFADFAARRDSRDELTELIEHILMTHTTQHWLHLFSGRIPIAPVLDIAQALDNPYVEQVNMLQSVAHPVGIQRLLRNPIKLDGQRLSGRACPPLNTDTDTVLHESGSLSDSNGHMA